jgi:hypothetical protein
MASATTQQKLANIRVCFFIEVLPFPDLPAGLEPPSLSAFRGERAHFRSARRAEQWMGDGLGQERMWPAKPLKRRENKQNMNRDV